MIRPRIQQATSRDARFSFHSAVGQIAAMKSFFAREKTTGTPAGAEVANFASSTPAAPRSERLPWDHSSCERGPHAVSL